MAVRRFGQWNKAKQILGTNLGSRLAQALRQATVKNAMLLVREIKKGIVSQAPGDQPFAKLADVDSTREAEAELGVDETVTAIRREFTRQTGHVCPTGTTYGRVAKPGSRCANCGRPAAGWNSGAGRYLCDEHWDDY